MPTQDARSIQHVRNLNKRFTADRQLQMELDKGMDRLAAGAEEAIRQRLARLLSAVLEPAWVEHTSLQSEALCPLIVKHCGPTTDVSGLLAQLRHELEEISRCHRDVSSFLGNVIVGRRSGETGLSDCLIRTVALRRNHYMTEQVLVDMVPDTLDTTDCDALEHWERTRTAAGFPINLILDIWD